MSSSESSYTWDDWYNRQNPNNEKNRRLDKQHHEVADLKQQRDELLEALQELLDCPYVIDEATVISMGLEETMRLSPYQVVGNMSVALLRVRKARAAIAKAKGAAA